MTDQEREAMAKEIADEIRERLAGVPPEEVQAEVNLVVLKLCTRLRVTPAQLVELSGGQLKAETRDGD